MTRITRDDLEELLGVLGFAALVLAPAWLPALLSFVLGA